MLGRNMDPFAKPNHPRPDPHHAWSEPKPLKLEPVPPHPNPHRAQTQPNPSQLPEVVPLRRVLTQNPNPSKWPEQHRLRLHQWRRNSHNPFDTEEGGKSADKKPEAPKTKHPELRYPGSKWVHLFYDLAWAASFSSLTGNGKFDNPLDTVNYFLFFTAVLWMWASQALYSIHFYTNDWFHLTLVFFQLFIFGMLAATTQGR
ncbi:unnamed protein product [Rhizoctonia solani]|uniref:Uncharacterized protein n=1 Tax=Rhizoctonia solani TaxID=456999 RepID=A0A8H3I2I3_9AGAM|nr:unnamed protein product [Rhizoctonia solani]